MPLKKKTWDSIPEREQRNNHYGKEEFDAFEDEIAKLAEEWKKEMAPEEFSEWLASEGREWIAD